METRRLGRLGHQSSVLIYGAAALAGADEGTAERSVQEALDGGINHFDVAAGYGDAEVRLGERMGEMRNRIFLATKTDQRGKDAAWEQIGRSLERLRTGHVDLLQLHAVGTRDELDLVTRTGGALESAVRAVEEGMVGAIGITGHGVAAATTHLEALRRFPFATVLTPLNAALWRENGFRAAYTALVDEVGRQDAGLMTIKAISSRNWPDVRRGEPMTPQAHTTWYEPLTDSEHIRAAVSWTLAHQEIAGIATAGDVGLLGMIIAAEQNRMTLRDAEAVLSGLDAYESPFAAMPAGL